MTRPSRSSSGNWLKAISIVWGGVALVVLPLMFAPDIAAGVFAVVLVGSLVLLLTAITYLIKEALDD